MTPHEKCGRTLDKDKVTAAECKAAVETMRQEIDRQRKCKALRSAIRRAEFECAAGRLEEAIEVLKEAVK
jgi:hypothetical protein